MSSCYPDILIGYAGVSIDDQNLDLQRDALQRAGCKKKESGREGTKRPALEAALAFLRPEDQLVVWKVERLGRSLREMLDTAHKFQELGVKLRSLIEAVDTETPTGRLMFKFLGTIAEYFLEFDRERTLEGLKASAARGRRGGRRRKLGGGGPRDGPGAAQGFKHPSSAGGQETGREPGYILRLLPGAKVAQLGRDWTVKEPEPFDLLDWLAAQPPDSRPLAPELAPVSAAPCPDPVLLTRVDSTYLQLAPVLYLGACGQPLWRMWGDTSVGRVGTEGQSRTDWYEEHRKARSALRDLRRAKRKRGYTT